MFGKQFGNVFIGVQPTFGYEGDPMRLLFSRSASPHHGFAAYYTYLERVFKADAVLHFGTHGRSVSLAAAWTADAEHARPHHGFVACYTHLECAFQADAVLHFGTHGRFGFGVQPPGLPVLSTLEQTVLWSKGIALSYPAIPCVLGDSRGAEGALLRRS